MPKYVCMDCGCREVRGSGTAVADVLIGEDGSVEYDGVQWEHFEGIECSECNGNNILRIGTGQKYKDVS